MKVLNRNAAQRPSIPHMHSRLRDSRLRQDDGVQPSDLDRHRTALQSRSKGLKK